MAGLRQGSGRDSRRQSVQLTFFWLAFFGVPLEKAAGDTRFQLACFSFVVTGRLGPVGERNGDGREKEKEKQQGRATERERERERERDRYIYIYIFICIHNRPLKGLPKF